MSKTKQILITGGPVHAYLDSVKIITNRFKGGLMAKMVSSFVEMAEEGDADVKVTYLCSKSSQQLWWDDFLDGEKTPHAISVQHDGLEDYMEKVLQLAPMMDAVVLGAAVANLIPKNKIKGKFPSHNYQEGDTIPIDFTIAPRIIDRVKKVAPKTHLFGFKLLAGVEHSELIDAAYGVLLESKATAVFANDATKLSQKYAVCKDGSVHALKINQLPKWIYVRLLDRYYKTIHTVGSVEDSEKVFSLVRGHTNRFVKKYGMYFGAVAIRRPNGGFLTTGRGKTELTSCVCVEKVDHDERKIWTTGATKATLNAPLLDIVFKRNPTVETILHFHDQDVDLSTGDWSPPGTWEDAQRGGASFNIKGHGCILSYNKEGKQVF